MSNLALLVWLILFCQPPSSPSFDLNLRANLTPSLQKQLAELERDYDIVIYMDRAKFPKQRTISYNIQGDEARLLDLQHFLPIFIEEWRLMPVALVKRTKLKYIVFGTSFKLQRELMVRQAIPDYHHEGMYYDVHFSHSEPNAHLYFRSIIHHEFYHYIDFVDDGIVYDDKEWKKLNPKEFKYGNGGRYARGAEMGLVTNAVPGFISRYSTSGVEEDKAEVFRCMMLNLRETEMRAEEDPVLKSKVLRMKELLKTFSPEVDEAFWARLQAMDQPRLTAPGWHDAWAKAHPTLPSRASTMVASSTICNPPAFCEPIRSNSRPSLYDLSKAGYKSVLSYGRGNR